MKSVVLSRGAQLELRAAANWYAEQESGLGVEFVTEIDRVLTQLSEGGHRFAMWRPNRPYRKALVHRFPYVIFFLDEPSEVRVIAVAHQKRKPGYWIRRQR